jgi:CubicO group peptidase (beta-lactamase class C family)
MPGTGGGANSDTNFQLFIAIIEAVTSQPLHSFSKWIFPPLSLRHTYLFERSKPFASG